MAQKVSTYPATLEIVYEKERNRATAFFRLLLSIPILTLAGILSASGTESYVNEAGDIVKTNGAGIVAALFLATMLMIVFRQRYPKWWFDFALEYNRFTTRVGAYLFLLTDTYPSTVEKQGVELNVQYPNVKKDLNRWLPLVKWILAIPHYIVLAFLVVGAVFATIIAWFAIVFTGTYPRVLFDYVVGVGRWSLRVSAYSMLLVTDTYPPYSLK